MCISVLCCSLLNCLTAKYIKELTTERCSPGGVLMDPGGFTAEKQGFRTSCAHQEGSLYSYHKL